MSWLRFTSPAFLVLLPLAVLWIWRTGPSPLGARSIRSVLVRCVIAALLVLALAGLQFRTGSSPVSLVFAIDRSQSMVDGGAETLPRVSAVAAAMRSGDTAAAVAFGADATVERALGEDLALTRIESAVDSSGTDIAGAIRTARSIFTGEGDRRVLLLSDGHQTSGDAVREASLAAADGIRIDVLVPSTPPASNRPLRVRRFTAPSVVRASEPYPLTAVVEGPPRTRARLLVEGSDNRTQAIALETDTNGLAVVTFDDRQARAGTYAYQAAVHPLDDMIPRLDDESGSAGAVVVVTGASRVLYAGSSPAPIVAPLSSAGILVDRYAALPAATQLASTLATYDAVILDDIPPGQLDEGQTSALARFVEAAGGGLLVLAGPRSLDPGLAGDHPLARLLPVDVRPRQGVRSSPVALVVVFDKSGSMDDRVGGTQKIELARQAVQRALESMPPTDPVGVIAFDAGVVPVMPLSPSSRAADLRAQLRGVEPGGGTAIAPALELARDWLRKAAAEGIASRHVLLVSDGRTTSADALRAAQAVRGEGIEVTAVALGAASDRDLLADLAASTGGRAFFPDDVRELPAILVREAVRVSGGGVVEETFTPRVERHPLLQGIEAAMLPPLRGYVVSATKSGAEAPLQSHLEDPILAAWQAGLGRVAVYTADLHSNWSSSLRASDVFAPLVTRTVRWVARRAYDPDVSVRLVDDPSGAARLIVEAVDPTGTYRSSLDARAVVRAPSGRLSSLNLAESSPGRYEAVLANLAQGPHSIAVDLASRDGQYATALVRGVYWPASREQRHTGVNRDLLAAVAAASGGTLLGDDGRAVLQDRHPAYHDARQWLLALALAVFVAGVLSPGVSLMAARFRLRRARVAPPRTEAA